MATLFAKKKAEAATQPKKAKNEKVVVDVDLGDKLSQLQKVREEIADLEAKATMLEGDIKPVARKEFINLYIKNRSRPDSFILSSNCGKLLVIMQDKYLTVTDAKENTLKENGLAEVIDEKTTYKFDETLLNKYEEQVSNAIMAMDIPDADKEAMIIPEVKKSVKKGTIERLTSFENMELAFNLIEPVVQLKNQ